MDPDDRRGSRHRPGGGRLGATSEAPGDHHGRLRSSRPRWTGPPDHHRRDLLTGPVTTRAPSFADGALVMSGPDRMTAASRRDAQRGSRPPTEVGAVVREGGNQLAPGGTDHPARTLPTIPAHPGIERPIS